MYGASSSGTPRIETSTLMGSGALDRLDEVDLTLSGGGVEEVAGDLAGEVLVVLHLARA